MTETFAVCWDSQIQQIHTAKYVYSKKEISDLTFEEQQKTKGTIVHTIFWKFSLISEILLSAMADKLYYG